MIRSKKTSSPSKEQADAITRMAENIVSMTKHGHGVKFAPKDAAPEELDAVAWLQHAHPDLHEHITRRHSEDMALFAKKQYNYGLDNIKAGEDISTETGKQFALTLLWGRMNDKMQRIKQIAIKGRADQVGEAVQETLQDLRNYALIFEMVENGRWR